jgi:hypothetical protein
VATIRRKNSQVFGATLVRKNKQKLQVEHARRRFRERYGIVLNEHQYKYLSQQISDNRAKFIEKQSNRVSVFELKYENQMVRVVYDKQTKQIVTVLPTI